MKSIEFKTSYTNELLRLNVEVSRTRNTNDTFVIKFKSHSTHCDALIDNDELIKLIAYLTLHVDVDPCETQPL